MVSELFWQIWRDLADGKFPGRLEDMTFSLVEDPSCGARVSLESLDRLTFLTRVGEIW